MQDDLNAPLWVGVYAAVREGFGFLLRMKSSNTELTRAVQEAARGVIEDLRRDVDDLRKHRDQCEADLAELRSVLVQMGAPIPAYRPDLPRGGAPE